MKIATHHTDNRPAFTLVELLVSMALTLFIMTILVEAFGAGMDTFQNMRALGDVQDSLRSGLNLLKADLSQDHFEGGKKTNDINFWEEPRREGFVFIEQGSKLNSSTKYVDEGTDLDGINKSFLAADHRLSFSMRLRGNRRDNFGFDMNGAASSVLLGKRLSATNPAVTSGYAYDSFAAALPKDYPAVTSQWLEVGYFLGAPQGSSVPPAFIPGTDAASPGPPAPPAYGPIYLYNLYRAAVLTVPFADELNKSIPATPYLRMSRNVATGKFLSPNDLAKGPASRTKLYDLTKPISAQENAAVALVCTNVVSFQIRVLKDPPTPGFTGYEDLFDTNKGTLEPYDSATRPASGYRLLGVQIVLRVYDPSSGLTRQATLNHDF